MLSRTHRFHGYNSLKPTYTKGASVRTSLITARYMNRGTGKPYRVAVVVSKKVSKSAVIRNRIRRRVFEVVRLQSSPIPEGTDIVLTVFNEQVAVLESTVLETTVADLLGKITASRGIVKDN